MLWLYHYYWSHFGARHPKGRSISPKLTNMSIGRFQKCHSRHFMKRQLQKSAKVIALISLWLWLMLPHDFPTENTKKKKIRERMAMKNFNISTKMNSIPYTFQMVQTFSFQFYRFVLLLNYDIGCRSCFHQEQIYC